ncbi:prepilin-type N-terminal cleavage/methylation domain-containing protein [Patescibacteria group bacterium]|nr:prepilin-type N-terminal cleavage/methylation domain-containing protein [Patescibacteria group bacterium]
MHFDFERKQIGFSLIEIIIAVAVLGILAVLAVSGFSSFKASGELFRAADTIVGALNNARSQTLASRDDSQYGVFFDQNQNQIVFFAGNYYNASSPTNEITELPTQIEISSLSLTNATTAIAFARLSGDPSATGTVVLRIKGNTLQTKTIQINDSGTAEIK